MLLESAALVSGERVNPRQQSGDLCAKERACRTGYDYRLVLDHGHRSIDHDDPDSIATTKPNDLSLTGQDEGPRTHNFLNVGIYDAHAHAGELSEVPSQHLDRRSHGSGVVGLDTKVLCGQPPAGHRHQRHHHRNHCYTNHIPPALLMRSSADHGLS
jgi:hypothetical protein